MAEKILLSSSYLLIYVQLNFKIELHIEFVN